MKNMILEWANEPQKDIFGDPKSACRRKDLGKTQIKSPNLG